MVGEVLCGSSWRAGKALKAWAVSPTGAMGYGDTTGTVMAINGGKFRRMFVLCKNLGNICPSRWQTGEIWFFSSHHDYP